MATWPIGSEKTVARLALECHNSTYSTGFSLRGRAEDVFPELRGQENWDWVCIDGSSGEEGAVEVKRLTREFPEKVAGYLRKLGQAVSHKLRDGLTASYLVRVGMLGPDVKMSSRARRQLIDGLASLLLDMIPQTSQDKHASRLIRADHPLSHLLPSGSWLDLHKIDDAQLKPEARGNHFLHIDFGWASHGATGRLPDEELVKFQKLVEKGNQQLGLAKQRGIRQTFFVLAELGYSGAEPEAVESSLSNPSLSDYCHGEHIYLVGFEGARRIGGSSTGATP